MCLIISKPADVNFDEGFLHGVYTRNKDGVGVMYAEDNKLWHAKFVPKTFEEVVTFWDKHIAQRKCVVHFRMQTHGDVDTLNAHPYPVITGEEGYPLYLIHNGILHTNNMKDIKRSDTWHYIQDYLRPMLLKNPEFFLTEAFADLVGSHIGSGNKFVLLDHQGNEVLINKSCFIKHNGALLSNTYAWDTSGTRFAPQPYFSNFKRSEWPTWDESKAVDNKPFASLLDDDDEDLDELCEQNAFKLYELFDKLGWQKAYAELEVEPLSQYCYLFEKTMSTILHDIEKGLYSEEEFIEEVLNYA